MCVMVVSNFKPICTPRLRAGARCKMNPITVQMYHQSSRETCMSYMELSVVLLGIFLVLLLLFGFWVCFFFKQMCTSFLSLLCMGGGIW